jgi:hypothetical protein
MGGEERADKLFRRKRRRTSRLEARNAAGGAIHHAKIARRRTEAGWRAAVLDERGRDMLLACERAANSVGHSERSEPI